MNDRRKILVMADWFSPGFKAGGPIRSCVNFAQYMKDGYDVYVFTGDRDLGDAEPYKDVVADQWISNNGLQLFYASPGYLKWKNILQEVKKLAPDYIYLNSMFSRYFAIYPLLMKRQGEIKAKVILAPRGMLKESAVSFKPFKKKLFLTVLRAMQVQKHISFQATDATEVKDVRKYFGGDTGITYLPNFPGTQPALVLPSDKKPGYLKMIFVGRVHPIKNLDFLLRALQSVRATVELTIVGMIEDAAYMYQCNQLIALLPETIKVHLISDVPHHQLEIMLTAHHLFCLPTQGENFGHAIFEALATGRPVLISDQTPWKNLAIHKAGWDISLNNPADFIKTIEITAAMNAGQFNEWCSGAWQYCHNYIAQSDIKEQYRQLFN